MDHIQQFKYHHHLINYQIDKHSPQSSTLLFSNHSKLPIYLYYHLIIRLDVLNFNLNYSTNHSNKLPHVQLPPI